MKEALQLFGKREVFWDDYLLDTEKTTATHKLHHLTEAGCVMAYDHPWEGNSCIYQNLLVEPNGLIRMYYTGCNLDLYGGEKPIMSPIYICYAESRDGIHWKKPNLGIVKWNGSTDNNILLDGRKEEFDNFRVFRDDNPDCPPEEKYKALAMRKDANKKRFLWCYTSADAIHFTPGWILTDKGYFDSLNNAFWDAERKLYHCYFRSLHGDFGRDLNKGVRDIRYMSSPDFKNWTEPVLLDFRGKEDYPLYTNCISIYNRAPQMFIGFPTRYVERLSWTPNYDRLCGVEDRKRRMAWEPRIGLAVTDCVFMCSRDGASWYRYDDAFIRPGAETPLNWVYGCCYPTLGILETPALYGRETELSMYAMQSHFCGNPAKLMRYTLRKDGFASLNAPYAGATVTTKPFLFDGKGIALNFSTSARGYLYVTLTAADGTIAKSCEIFGDSCDRIIDFDIDLAAFAGKETVMEIKMRDADLYAVKFD